MSKEKQQYEVLTLVTGDGLSTKSPRIIIEFREEVSLIVEAILKTGGPKLYDLFETSKKASELLDWSSIQGSNGIDIKRNISKYLEKIEKFLLQNNFPSDDVVKTIRKLGYELFNAWLKNLVLSAGLSIPTKYVEVPESLKNQIKNILLDEDELTSLLIFLTQYGFIELSENIGNNFEEESENKILDIDREGLIADLKSLGAVKTFEGRVDDDYYDFIDNRLETAKKEGTSGRSFRIREKLDLITGDVDRYYTIKRKKPENTEPSFRVCYEIEMRILKHQGVLSILDRFGLKKFREKAKDRVSFAIYDKDDHELSVKFDIDDYKIVSIEGKEILVPTVLEIETNSKSLAEYYIKKLGLESNVKLVTGSRGLFKYYSNIQVKNGKPKSKK